MLDRPKPRDEYPQGNSWQVCLCNDPNCKSIHLLVFDKTDKVIVEAVIDLDLLEEEVAKARTYIKEQKNG